MRELEHTNYLEEQPPQLKKNKIIAIVFYSFLLVCIFILLQINGFFVHEMPFQPLESSFGKVFTLFIVSSLWLFLVRFTWKEWSSQRFFRYLQYLILAFSLAVFVGRFAIYNIQHHAAQYANQMKHDQYNDPVLIAMMDFSRTTDFPDTVTYKQTYDKGTFEIYTMSFLNKPRCKVLNDEECLRSIQEWVKKTEQETLQEHRKPFINLQFIYNALYQNQFK